MKFTINPRVGIRGQLLGPRFDDFTPKCVRMERLEPSKSQNHGPKIYSRIPTLFNLSNLTFWFKLKFQINCKLNYRGRRNKAHQKILPYSDCKGIANIIGNITATGSLKYLQIMITVTSPTREVRLIHHP